jgi:hypothetical protein
LGCSTQNTPVIENGLRCIDVDLTELEAILVDECDDVRGGGGAWEMLFGPVRMACMTDVQYDRMRLIAPIIEIDGLSTQHLVAMLEANFHTALDARYTISDEVVFAAFIHPLSPLSDGELRAALQQVASLVQTFGDDYSSGELVFAPGGGEDLN